MPDRKKLYDNILASQKVTEAEIGSFDVFNKMLDDSAKANTLYTNLINKAGFTEKELGSLDQFYSFTHQEPVQAKEKTVAPPVGENSLPDESIAPPEAKPQLSFQEEKQPETPDFMGLLDMKDKVNAASSRGVSVSFLDEIGKNAAAAERPVEYLFDIKDLGRRLEKLPQYFPHIEGEAQQLQQALSNANSQTLPEIKQATQELEAKAMQSRPLSIGFQNVGMMPGTQDSRDPKWEAYEAEVLKNPTALATKSLLNKTEEVKKVTQETGRTKAGLLLEGTGEGLKTYVEGYTKFSEEIMGNVAVRKLGDKIKDPANIETLDTDERILLKAMVDNYETMKALNDKIPTAYKIGKTTGESLGFMAEFMATFGVGGGVASGIRGGVRVGAGKVAKLSASAVAKVVHAGIQTQAMPSLYRNTAIDVSKGVNFGEALLSNYWDLTAENLSERIFMRNPTDLKGLNTADVIFRRMGVNMSVEKGWTGLAKNVLEEATEEKLSAIMTAPKDHESFMSFWKAFTDREENTIMLGSVALMVGAPGVATVGADKAMKVYDDVTFSRISKKVSPELKAEVDIIFDNKKLPVKEQFNIVEKVITDKLESGQLEGDLGVEVSNALRYSVAKAKKIQQETAEKEQESQLEYLQKKGVEVPDGTTMAELGEMYNEEKKKEEAAREGAKPAEPKAEVPKVDAQAEAAIIQKLEGAPAEEIKPEEGVMSISEEAGRGTPEKAAPEGPNLKETEDAKEITPEAIPPVPEEGAEGQEAGQGSIRDARESGKIETPEEGKTVIPAPILEKANKAFTEASKVMEESQAALESFKSIERSEFYQKLDEEGQQQVKEKYFNEITERYTSRPTEKKTREKLPAEGSQVTVSERAALNSQITLEARAAREGKQFSDKQFKETSKKILSMIKEARDSKNITSGQYRSIVRRLGAANTEKRRGQAYAYVEKVIEGSEYRGQVKIAQGHISSVSKNSRLSKSRFGDATMIARDYKNIDPEQMTTEELYEFNKISSRIFQNKKNPNITALQKAVYQFGDKVKEVTPRKRAESASDLFDAADKIQLKIDEMQSAGDYISAGRAISKLWREATRLSEEGVLSDTEIAAIEEKLGSITEKSDAKAGEFEEQLSEYKSSYADDIIVERGSQQVKAEIASLPEESRLFAKELFSYAKEELLALKMADLEAYREAVDNLAAGGYLTPEAALIRRKLATNRKAKSLEPALKNITGSQRWGKLNKQEFQEKIISWRDRIKGKAGRRARSIYDNLLRYLKSTKGHRIDIAIGNMSKYDTVGSAYTEAGWAAQMAENFIRKEQKELRGAVKAFRKAFKKASERDKVTRQVGQFLIEKTWRGSNNYDPAKVTKDNASINDYNYTNNPAEAKKSAHDKQSFDKDRKAWEEFRGQMKDAGAVTEVNGVEVIDIEKAEAILRQTPAIAKMLDYWDGLAAKTKEKLRIAALENGRSFVEQQYYFPLQRKRNGREYSAETIMSDINAGAPNMKMQAGATFERKPVLQQLETNIIDVARRHIEETARNYYVYPKIKTIAEALRISSGKIADENIKSKGDDKNIKILGEAIYEDLAGRLARYYQAGEYRQAMDGGRKLFDRVLKGSKKGLLARPERIPAEMAANTIRASISSFNIPAGDLNRYSKYHKTYNEIIDSFVGDRHMSRWGEEVKYDVFSGGALKAAEQGADFIITFSDNVVGRPLFVHEFNKAFKELTGQDFNASEYKNEDYRANNQEALDKAAGYAIRRVEELFNDKSPLTKPQLTKFLGGLVKAKSEKTFSQVFDYLQSFNRNELEQIVDSARRVRHGDAQQKWMGVRDIASIVISNFTYNVIRAAAGLAVARGINDLVSKDDDEWVKEQIARMETADFYIKKFATSNISLTMGGSQNIYGTMAKWGMFLVDQTDLFTEDQKEEIYKVMEDDYYVRHIPPGGTAEMIAGAMSPINVISDDWFSFVEHTASLINAASEADVGKKELFEFIDILNLGTKYFMPNPISPTLQKQLERELRNIKDANGDELLDQIPGL